MKQHLTAFCLFIDRYDITKFHSKILNTSSDIAETIHKFYLFFTLKSVGTIHNLPSVHQQKTPHMYIPNRVCQTKLLVYLGFYQLVAILVFP